MLVHPPSPAAALQAIAAAAGGLARLAEGGPSQAVRGGLQVEFGELWSPKAWRNCMDLLPKYGNLEGEEMNSDLNILERVEDMGT